MVTKTMSLQYPNGCQMAAEAWGANCGPCSLAAILGRFVHDVRPYLGAFEQRQYMNPSHMKEALDALGIPWRSVGPQRPTYGLAFLQWGGHEKKPIRVQYQFTHWIAVAREFVFEVNAPRLVSWTEWQEVMPTWIKELGKGDGTFRVRTGLEIEGMS